TRRPHHVQKYSVVVKLCSRFFKSVDRIRNQIHIIALFITNLRYNKTSVAIRLKFGDGFLNNIVVLVQKLAPFHIAQVVGVLAVYLKVKIRWAREKKVKRFAVNLIQKLL